VTGWPISTAGLLIVLLVLLDMFHALANPGALGRMEEGFSSVMPRGSDAAALDVIPTSAWLRLVNPVEVLSASPC
jgi:hypothetical protein